jgi:hypothetical protein
MRAKLVLVLLLALSLLLVSSCQVPPQVPAGNYEYACEDLAVPQGLPTYVPIYPDSEICTFAIAGEDNDALLTTYYITFRTDDDEQTAWDTFDELATDLGWEFYNQDEFSKNYRYDVTPTEYKQLAMKAFEYGDKVMISMILSEHY